MTVNYQGQTLQGIGGMTISGNIVNQKGTPILSACDVDHSRNLGQGIAGTPSSVTVPLGEMLNSGTIKRASAHLVTACTGNATVTIDIKKNGTTILSAAITLSSAHAARQVVGGTLTVTTFSDGDVFEAVIVATVGTGALGTGLRFDLFVDEDYSGS